MTALSRTRWTWVEAAQRGDDAAIEAFVAKYRPALVGYLRRRGAGGDSEDIAQEVLLSLFGGKTAIDRARRGEIRLRSFVFVLTRDAFVAHQRSRQAQKRGGALQRVPMEQADVAAHDDAAVFDREWYLRLLDLCLERLRAEHPRYHRAVRECVLRGRPQADLAADLGCTVTAVKNHARRGKKKLAEFLGEEVWATTSSKEAHTAELRALGQLAGGVVTP